MYIHLYIHCAYHGAQAGRHCRDICQALYLDTMIVIEMTKKRKRKSTKHNEQRLQVNNDNNMINV